MESQGTFWAAGSFLELRNSSPGNHSTSRSRRIISTARLPPEPPPDAFPELTPAASISIVSDIAPRPDRVAPVHMLKKQTQWFSTSSFADAIGHFGSSPNGVLLSPGLELWDLSAIKNVKFGDRVTFQFRGEFFNAFNHTNFGQPSLSGGGIGTNTDSSNFGQVTAAHDPREIQLGGKLYF